MELRFENEHFERSDPAAIRAYQWGRLKPLLAHVLETNEFYADGWRAAGVDLDRVNSLEDFSSIIPMFEKKDYVDDQLRHPPFGKRLEHAVSLGEQIEVYTTSGTSGQGVEVHAQTMRELKEMPVMHTPGMKCMFAHEDYFGQSLDFEFVF